jgi:hypothetical protein
MTDLKRFLMSDTSNTSSHEGPKIIKNTTSLSIFIQFS